MRSHRTYRAVPGIVFGLLVCIASVRTVLNIAARRGEAAQARTSLNWLNLGRDRDALTLTNTLGTGDTFYAIASVSSPGRVKVIGRLVVDEVEGQVKGPIPGLETTVDLMSTGTANFVFTPPTAGWPKGQYSLEVLVIDEGGVEKDKQSAAFAVL